MTMTSAKHDLGAFVIAVVRYGFAGKIDDCHYGSKTPPELIRCQPE
jgi:hypothetical protein